MALLNRSARRCHAVVNWPLETLHRYGRWYGHTARVLVRYDWDGGDAACGEPPGVESWEPLEVQSLGVYEWCEHTSAPRQRWVETPGTVGKSEPWLLAAIRDQIEQADWREKLVVDQIVEQHMSDHGRAGD